VTIKRRTVSVAQSVARDKNLSRAGVGEKQGSQGGSGRGWRYPGGRSSVWEEVRLEGHQQDPGAGHSLGKQLERVQKAAAWLGRCPRSPQDSTASHPTGKGGAVSRKGLNRELGNKDELTFHLN